MSGADKSMSESALEEKWQWSMISAKSNLSTEDFLQNIGLQPSTSNRSLFGDKSQSSFMSAKSSDQDLMKFGDKAQSSISSKSTGIEDRLQSLGLQTDGSSENGWSKIEDRLQWSMLSSNLNVATEDHLQSLGLQPGANDRLPEFKLNEPGPAGLASSIFQQNNMVNDETEQSFVVLGKSSLDSIRESSLASYMEIQQKSTLTDHDSMISMMSPSEIESSLKKVLEENVKLKETLKQNNQDIKQQFNTITMWQKEVMTVCDNHKQKFLETKELINNLKKENDELRQIRDQLSQNHSQDSLTSTSTKVGSSLESNASSVLKNSDYHMNVYSIPDLTNCTIAHSKEITEKLESVQVLKENEVKFLKKISTLNMELNEAKMNHLKIQEVYQELERRYATDIELFSQQLQKANKELDSLKQKSNVSNPLELQKLVNQCCEKDIELKYLKEIIVSLEQQIKRMEQDQITFIEVLKETSEENSPDRCLLKQNIEFYNTKLSELGKCFSSQWSRYLRIQGFLKESADIIQTFENAQAVPNDILSEDKIKDYRSKLCDYRKKLIDEQVENIDDKQMTIKVQKQFQKILSDYNSVIYELEILKDENAKLTTMQAKESEENSQKLADIEKYLIQEKKILDEERASLLEQRLDLQIEKKSVVEEKEKIEAERNSLSLEKEKLIEAKTSLVEERTSLDRQSKLYDAEEATIQKEKVLLQYKCDSLIKTIENLKQNLHEANEQCSNTAEQLHVNNCKLKENEDMISVYKLQLEMHESSLEEMRASQKILQDQLQSLAMANLQLRTDNDSLGGGQEHQETGEGSASRLRYCSFCASYVRPEEQHGLGHCIPELD